MKGFFQTSRVIAIGLLLLGNTLAALSQPVVTFSPASGTGYPATQIITISFNEPVRGAVGNVVLTNANVDGYITLKETDGSGANIPFDATVNSSSTTMITITPNSPLPALTDIYVSLGLLESIATDDDIAQPAEATFTTADYEAVVTQQSTSVATGIAGSATDRVLMAFKASTNGIQTFDEAIFTLTIDPTVSTLLTNYRLIDNGSTSTYTSGGGTSVGTVTANGPAKTLTFATIGVSLSATDKYFFLVADADPSVNALNGSVSTTFTSATVDQGNISGTGFTEGPIPFQSLTATFNPIVSGVPLSNTPLEAGTSQAVLAGFSMVSNGNQTMSQINFSITGGVGTLSNYKLFRSTAPGVVGSSIASNATSSFSALSEVISSTTTYFYLVADVNSTLTTATSSATVILDQSNITLNAGTKGSLNVNRSLSFTESKATVAASFTGQFSIDDTEYANTQSVLTSVTSANSQRIFAIDITDGDSDSHSTTITQLAFTVANFDNLATISLFDGATKIGSSLAVSGSSILFSGLNYVINDGTTGSPNTKTLDIRVTFAANVTDNEVISAQLVGAATLAGGSSLAPFAGIQTSGSNNIIDVVATKLIFIDSANPPPPFVPFTGPLTVPVPPQPGSTFSATVWAVDASNNLDLDQTSPISLNVTGGAGSLTGGGSQSLVGGVRQFNSLSVNNIGTYDLNATDAGPLADANSTNGGTNITLNIESIGTSITPANLTACKVGTGNFFTALPNLVLTENDNSDFTPGTNLTFLLILPAGWEFLTPSTTSPTPAYSAPSISYTASRNFSAASFTNFIGTNIAKFTYTVSGTNKADVLTISGLYIKNVSGNATGTIYRSGTGLIKGADETKSMGTLTTSASSTSLSFTVQSLPGDIPIDPNTINYSTSNKNVELVGSPTGGVFSGNGVALDGLNGYVFSPSSSGPGNQSITYTYQDPSSPYCLTSISKSFLVSSPNIIQNLQNTYCRNGAPSSALSVLPAQIAQDFPPGYDPADPAATYVFQDFVYNNNTTQTCITIFIFFCYYPDNFVPIGPTNNIFDPQSANYSNVISLFNYVQVSYRVRRLSDNAIFVSRSRQTVIINQPPVVSFTIPKSSFCATEPAVDLTGTPTPTSVVANDFFTETPSGSVANSGGSTWRFTPANAGVSSTPKSIDITYTYQDPSTGCSNTSAIKTVTVYPIPTLIPAASISPATTIETCQGGIVGSFTATPTPGVTYNWYSDNSLLSLQRQGDLFSPAVSNAVAATTDFYVTRTINGCESTSPRQVSVVVNPTPAAPGSDFSRSYCLTSTVPASDFTITGSSVKWYSSSDNFTTPIFSGNNPTAANLGISTAAANAYSFQTTQTSNKGCESPPIKVIVTVKDLPSLTITSSVTDLTKICRSNDDLNFKANQPNGIWSGTASSALFNTIPAFGSTQLKSLNLAPGTFSLQYDYTDAATTCSNSVAVSLTILPTIIPSLTVSDACDGFFVDLTNNSSISPVSSTSTIDSIAWDFGDQSSLPRRLYLDPIPSGFSAITKGTFKSPSHLFKSVGTFAVNYLMKTSDGCEVLGTKQVINHEVPKAAFAWFNSCFDTNSNTANVQFTGANLNSNLTAGEIQSYNWNFAKTSSLIVSSAGSGKTPLTTYSTTGRDSVQLVVTTVNNCRDTIQKSVFIVPSYPAINENNSYFEDFNTTSGGWINGGTNSSWQHGNPAAPIINRDSSATGNGQAWVTNLTGNNNANEQSWVLSQCYDFSQALKPVLSMDIWSDTPRPIDGAVLQYNESNSIESNANWKVLGQINQGTNWYDINGIASKPGNQATVDVGWSGDQSQAKYKKGWVHAVFKLDELIGKPNVKFRIAFASNFGRQEGFAFDNVFIGERSRSVLIENFTNSSSEANSTLQNSFFNAFGASTNEIVKVQFHTGFPGYDTLNGINKPMNNARTAFYGITNSPTARIDGKVGVGPLTSWFPTVYDDRVLSPSPLKIVIDTPSKIGDVVGVTAKITNTTSSSLNLKDANIFVIIAEKNITTMPWLGQSGNAEFKYVARQMLPSPAGIAIAKSLAPGETFEMPQVLWSQRDLINSGNGVIIIYVQSLLNDKEVYQAKVYDNPVQPDLVTGTEPLLSEHIKLYPNPADQSVTIELPQPVLENTPLKMYDVNGQEVKHEIFESGQHIKKIATENFAAGIYLIQMQTSHSTIRKKLMILHQ